MNGSDAQDTRQRRRRLIERLNAKEAELSESQDEQSRLSEREIELEKEKQRNYSRRGFSQML
jgi:hypothetical protein